MTSQVIFLLLSATLALFGIVIPLRRAHHLQVQDDFLKKLHAFKLIAVRRAYPSLKALSFNEIEDRYDLDDIYERIGKNRVRN